MQGVKPRRFLGAAVVAMVGIWVAAAAPFPADSAAKPSLSLASETPLVVAGRGFKAGERVTVVASLTQQGEFRKRIAAGSSGRFRVRFRSADASCGPVYVAAVGRQGSRAALRRRGVPGPCGIDPGPER
jgi:hypothetical protein